MSDAITGMFILAFVIAPIGIAIVLAVLAFERVVAEKRIENRIRANARVRARRI